MLFHFAIQRYILGYLTADNKMRKTTMKTKCLFLPLINLIQEALENLPLQPLLRTLLRDSLNQPDDLLVRLLFILRKLLPNPDLLIHILHLRLRLGVLPPVVRVQDSALRRRGVREGDVDAPRALVVDDVRADLAEGLGRG